MAGQKSKNHHFTVQSHHLFPADHLRFPSSLPGIIGRKHKGEKREKLEVGPAGFSLAESTPTSIPPPA
ncbi:MAG: hypothetical protein DRN35_03835 [Thermoplasmata archaeon]|nr:MAG: hypothetical protein DRN35_03835 [Thermoplasmata archaeon]RLF73045.1 MAG: hypothetical protein DRN55_04750 [Thermoplasmata archaeon]